MECERISFSATRIMTRSASLRFDGFTRRPTGFVGRGFVFFEPTVTTRKFYHDGEPRCDANAARQAAGLALWYRGTILPDSGLRNRVATIRQHPQSHFLVNLAAAAESFYHRHYIFQFLAAHAFSECLG